MARFVTELMLRLIDGASAPARQAAASIGGITKAIRENNVQKLSGVSRQLGGRIRGLTGDLVGAGGALTAFGFALAGPIKSATEFEAKLTTIGQKAELSRAQTRAMGEDLTRASRETNQFAKDLAAGVDVLAGAGLKPDVALNMIRPIGKAATAYKADIADLATASYAAYSNLKIPIKDIGEALDVMAKAGKEGNFEINEMAQYLPSIAAAAQAAGQEGVPALADLAAALQVVRAASGSSAEAATNVANLLQKMRAPGTVKAFEKMGVDLVASLNKLEAEGRTPIEAISELTNKTLKGDLSRLGYLFQDAEVQKALRPLIQDMQKYKDIREKAGKAKGIVDKDFIDRMNDAEQKMQAAKVAAANLALTFGQALKPAFGFVAGSIGPVIERITAFIAAHPRLVANVALAIGALLAFRTATIAVNLASTIGKKAVIDMALSFMGAPGAVMGFGRSLIALINPMGLVRGALGLLRLAMIGNPIGLAAVAIGVAAVFIIKHWRGFVTFFQGVGRGVMAALAPVMPSLQPLIAAFKAFGGWIASFFKSNPGEDWSKWGFMVGKAIAWPTLTLINFVKWVGECLSLIHI